METTATSLEPYRQEVKFSARYLSMLPRLPLLPLPVVAAPAPSTASRL